MKYSSIINLLLIVLIIISSCSKASQLEKEAKIQMEKTMKEIAKDPSSVQITDVKTVFSNDSICIIHYNFAARNGFGGVNGHNMEYVYIMMNDLEAILEDALDYVLNNIDKDKDEDKDKEVKKYDKVPYEFFLKLNEKDDEEEEDNDYTNNISILEMARNEFKEGTWKTDSIYDKMEEEDIKATIIYSKAMSKVLYKGRKVKEKNNNEDIENW